MTVKPLSEDSIKKEIERMHREIIHVIKYEKIQKYRCMDENIRKYSLKNSIKRFKRLEALQIAEDKKILKRLKKNSDHEKKYPQNSLSADQIQNTG